MKIKLVKTLLNGCSENLQPFIVFWQLTSARGLVDEQLNPQNDLGLFQVGAGSSLCNLPLSVVIILRLLKE
jgi:hypothetical protein